jgi:tetratricopeptide (TPR) repeat protein
MQLFSIFKNLSLVFFALCLFSCKQNSDTEVVDERRTDSLLNLINTPELKAINQKILDNPDDATLYNDRAKLYLKYKQYEDAISDAKRAIRIDSMNAQFYLTEADIFFASNETRNAKDVLELVVKKFPENTEGLLKLGELYYFVKQYENAFAKINQALKMNESLAKAYFLKGSIYKEIGDTVKAVSSLITAIEQDNQNYGAFLELGIIYASQGNPLALEYYNNALRIKPNSTEALYAKAKLLQDINKLDEAVLVYKFIVKQDSSHVASLYNLGAIEFANNNINQAMDYFTQAIQFNPTYAEAYFARGACYQELKDKNNAYSDYNMCLQLKPNYGPAVDGLNSLK